MTGEYAIQGIPARQILSSLRSSLQLLLLSAMAATLTGCQGTLSKEKSLIEKTPVVQPTTEVAQAQPDAGTPTAKITVEKSVVDLGEIGMNSKVSGKFAFVNSGQATLRILQVRSCCGVIVRGVEKGQEFGPGERGILEFDYMTGPTPLSGVKRELRLQTNDPEQKFVSLTIKASIVQRIETDPARLRLFLRQENAGCGAITIRSLDGKPFSIVNFKSTANTISAGFDPNVKATEFVLKPQADMDKLQRNVRGVVSIDLTHPECSNVRLLYDVLPEFTVNPAHLMVFNVHAGQPIQRDVWILSNYRDEFDVESVSSQKGYIKLLEKKKVEGRYQLRIEITPPAPDSDDGTAASSSDTQNPTAGTRQGKKNALVADMLEVKIQDGETLSIPFRGFYAAE